MRLNRLFLIILLIGLAVRLYKIDLPLLEFYPSRQIQTADITRNFISNDFNILKPTVSYLGTGFREFLVEFPLFNSIVFVFYYLFGVNEMYGRVTSLVFWVVSMILLYKIALAVTNREVAIYAIFFYSISPLSILISRSFQPDQMMLTFSLGAIYLILRFVEGKHLYFFLSIILASLSILSKPPSLLFTLIPAVYILWVQKKAQMKAAFLYILFTLIPSVLWYFYTFMQKDNALSEGSYSYSNWFGLELFLDPKFYSNIFGFEMNLVLLPVGMILFLLGLFTKLKDRQYFLYSWLVGVVTYFLIFNKHNMTHEYYHLPFLPVASIFIGIGAERILRNLGDFIIPKNLLFLILSILFLTFSMVYTAPRAYSQIDRFSWVVEVGDKLQKISRPNDLIIGSMDAGPSIVYYSQRHGWVFNANLEKEIETKQFYGDEEVHVPSRIEQLEQLKKKGATLFASAYKPQFLENKEFSDYLYQNYQILRESENYIIFDLTKPFP